MGEKGCALCFGLCLLAVVIYETLLSLKTYSPSCSIKDLYIPALDTRLPNFNSSDVAATFIFFDLQYNNDGVSYELFNPSLVFYYSRFRIANYSLPRFSDTEEDTAHMRDVVETNGMPWSEAVSGGLTATFAVEFSARVKVNKIFWIKEYKEVLRRADFEVNGYGEKVQKKDVKLKPFVKSVSSTLASIQSDASVNLYSA